ncbi:hypothetical protein BJ508DRAFT_417396 [Ascobolus immersus RN42]|uniref:Uncharacterized protein n=1 Tax=Ascobolus immersus RN42 TaxID=1160509 RepID=A0A3N4HSU6_ASCIM|nr:hypothetical protein BJ508DRAFT_417396 [Ascobolus immersus RN42]
MAPRRGGGGGGGSYGGGSSEPSTPAVLLFGAAYSNEDNIGRIVVLSLFLLTIFLALCFSKTGPKKTEFREAKALTDNRKWIRGFQVAGLAYMLSLILQIARWAELLSKSTVGRSFRVEAEVEGMFMGVVKVLLVGIIARICSLVLAGLVRQEGPDPELAKLRRWVGGALKVYWGLYAVVVLTQVSLGFALAEKAFVFYAANKFWRLGDRELALRLIGVTGTEGLGRERWEMLRMMFLQKKGDSEAWVGIRKAQIWMEVIGVILALTVLWQVGTVAFMKRNIRNVGVDSTNLVRRNGRTVARKFLFIVFPVFVVCAIFNLGVSIHVDVHNISIITSHSKWDALIDGNGARGWLTGYRTVFVGFPILTVVMQNLGWVVTFCMLSLLTRDDVSVKKKEWKPAQLVTLSAENRPVNRPVDRHDTMEQARREGMPYAQLEKIEARENRNKRPQNVSMWKWMLLGGFDGGE